MKIAILIRGFHFLDRDRFGFPMNGLHSLSSLEKYIINPLRIDHDVKLFTATYPSPVNNELMKTLEPDYNILLDSKISSQIGTFLEGIDLISEKYPDLDKLVCTRFDLEYLKSVLTWNVWGQDNGIYLPWREYESFWNLHHRVGDAIHVIDKEFIDTFRKAIINLDKMSGLHKLYDELKKATDNIYFIEEGFYDSNSLYSNVECYNPLYRISNRPRLPIRQPYRVYTAGYIEQRLSALVVDLASEYSRLRCDLRTPKKDFKVTIIVNRLLKFSGKCIFTLTCFCLCKENLQWLLSLSHNIIRKIRLRLGIRSKLRLIFTTIVGKSS
jgi:hypothetical protein